MYLVALNTVRVCMNSVMDIIREVAPSVNVNVGLFVRAVHSIDQRRLSPWSRGFALLDASWYFIVVGISAVLVFLSW